MADAGSPSRAGIEVEPGKLLVELALESGNAEIVQLLLTL